LAAALRITKWITNDGDAVNMSLLPEIEAAPSMKKPRIFIANPDDAHRAELLRELGRLFDVEVFFENGSLMQALHAAPPDLVVVDDRLLGGGRGCLYDKRKDPALRDIPFVVSGKPETGIEADVNDGSGIDVFLARPFSKNRIITRISDSLSISVEKEWTALPETQKYALQDTVHEFQNIANLIEEKRPLDLESSYESCKPLVDTINAQQYQGVLDGVKNHHNYTYVHSLRVATYLSIFGHAIGIRGNDLHTLATGGLLHDVGKMVTPQDMLNKTGKLEDKEWLVMKSHVEHTKTILDRTPGVNAGIHIIAEQHHEKLDGSGYPLGLAGDRLNELARMSAIVDIFGALTDERSYKPAFPPEKAFAILEDMQSGIDQHLLGVFREVIAGTHQAPAAQ